LPFPFSFSGDLENVKELSQCVLLFERGARIATVTELQMATGLHVKRITPASVVMPQERVGVVQRSDGVATKSAVQWDQRGLAKHQIGGGTKQSNAQRMAQTDPGLMVA
jgi:hypothetical protein